MRNLVRMFFLLISFFSKKRKLGISFFIVWTGEA